MLTTTERTNGTEIAVGMGQIAVIRAPDVGRTVLGSCIGLAIYDPELRVGTLAHIVLAEKDGRPGSPGKFADTAVPHMLKLLATEGAVARRLRAKLAGGAAMFGGGGPIQVGEANHQAVQTLLKQHRIPILGEHVGGPKGRRITFDVAKSEFIVEIVGEQPIVL